MTREKTVAHFAGLIRQQGFSLLEILIAVLLVSLALLSLAALQVKSLQANQEASDRSTAVVQAYAILDRMRANPVEDKRIYNNDVLPADNQAVNCAANSLCEQDFQIWAEQLKANLPTVDAENTSITCAAPVDGRYACSVQISWTNKQGEDLSVTIGTQM